MTAPNFLDFIFGPQSPELRGILNPQQQQEARRRSLFDAGLSMMEASQNNGFGASLAAGVRGGRDSYTGAVENQMAGTQYQRQEQDYATQQQLLQRRNEIANRYRMQPGETPEQTDNRLRQMMAEYLQIGDTESAGKISEYLKARGGSQAQKQEPGTWVTVPGPDGKPMRRYVTASEAGQGIPEYERPQRDTDDAMTINSRFQNEERLLNNYEKRIEGIQATVDAYMGAVGAAKMGGTGDLQILYSFIRALDPNSVVREGEVALARAAASLWSQAHVLKNKFENEGGTLSPVMRQQMMDLMKQMVELKSERADMALADARSRAQRFGLQVHLRDPMEKYRRATGGRPSLEDLENE